MTTERDHYEELHELLEEWAEIREGLIGDSGPAPVFADRVADLIWQQVLRRNPPPVDEF